MDSYTGEVRVFPYAFTPEGWALCDGSVLQIGQNTALYSLIATTFGGDGSRTFGLPNLNGRAAIGSGQGIGLSDRPQGDEGGAETVTLAPSQMPAHSHTANAMRAQPTTDTPDATVLPAVAIIASRPASVYSSEPEPSASMSVMATSVAGQTRPHENRQPFLVMNYFISLYGDYPQRP